MATTKKKEANKKSKPEKTSQVSSILKVQLIKSPYGRSKKQTGTLKGLGLTKTNEVSELKSSPEVLGMMNKVNHLIKVIG